MELAKRLENYKAIEEYRKIPLVVYATCTRPNSESQMAGDVVRELIGQLDVIPGGAEEIDIFLHSSGGDPLAAWKLMSVLRERFKKVNVLVPFMAFSAATLFSLGADMIFMHPHASLGPIDPQITVKLPDGKVRQFAYEDVGAFLRFLSEEANVTEQAQIGPLVDRIFTAVDPLVIGAAKRASELSTSVGERLLKMHMDDGEKPRQIAENLNKSFFAHGDAVSRSRARDLDLKIADDDPELENLMWKAYVGIEEYMELRKAFEPVQIFLADSKGRDYFNPMAPLIIPPNAPPQLVDSLWNAAAQQALARLSQPGVSVDFSLVNAVVESVRVASEFRTVGKISAIRAFGGDVQVSIIATEQGWKPCTIPADAT